MLSSAGRLSPFPDLITPAVYSHNRDELLSLACLSVSRMHLLKASQHHDQKHVQERLQEVFHEILPHCAAIASATP